MHEENADGHEDHERDQFCDRHHADGAGAFTHAADVDRREPRVDDEKDHEMPDRSRERRHERDHRAGEKVHHRRDAQDRRRVIKKPGDEADVFSESQLGVSVKPAGQRDPAAG